MKQLLLIITITVLAIFALKHQSKEAEPVILKTTVLGLSNQVRTPKTLKVILPAVELPEAPPVAAITEELHSAQALVEKEMAILYSLNIDWKEHELNLIEKLQDFPQNEIDDLGVIAVNADSNNDRRTLAVHLLSLAGQRASSALYQIAQSPLPELSNNDPHSSAALVYDYEMSLRGSAMAALDALSTETPEQVQKNMLQILTMQSSPTLKHFARISLMGIQQGRPGKLARYHDNNQL
ncbi:hypothetical protein ACLVWU_10520 [Bdellovibrio sp. HCB290]|uniref:hypothetical protein n=1 Tax=Bdellovibrio sp. HCB290 TaxID=3394356 RepID=UPI0039B54307